MTARHGTLTRWRQHQLDGDEPCDTCRRAKRIYDRRWRAVPLNTRKNRAHAAAQGRALRRVARLHREEYVRFYAEEKETAYREAGLEDYLD